MADPQVAERLRVTFTGGRMRRAEETPLEAWRGVFARQDTRGMRKRDRFAAWLAGRLFALRRPTGAESDGTVSYSMARAPTGYLDVLYLDEELRITRGNRGSIVIAKRA